MGHLFLVERLSPSRRFLKGSEGLLLEVLLHVVLHVLVSFPDPQQACVYRTEGLGTRLFMCGLIVV